MTMKSTALALVALAFAGAANAATVYTGTLSGSQETTPNASTATGFGQAWLSDDMLTLTVSLSWTGLSAPAAAGHIHCCAFLGANGPVAIDLEPNAVVTGTADGVFDLTLTSSFAPGFLNLNDGSADQARTTLINGLNSGQAYFNVHNQNFPAGEIRGQIAAVPEPASWALMIGGFGLVGAALRRRATIAA
jgi:hypothetical protein